MRRIRHPRGYQILHAGRILHANLRQHPAQTEQKVQNAPLCRAVRPDYVTVVHQCPNGGNRGLDAGASLPGAVRCTEKFRGACRILVPPFEA